MSLRTRVSLALGVILIVFGVAVALGPVLAPIVIHRPTVTPSRWLDMVFALFFIVRGVMNIRMAQRLEARQRADTSR